MRWKEKFPVCQATAERQLVRASPELCQEVTHRGSWKQKKKHDQDCTRRRPEWTVRPGGARGIAEVPGTAQLSSKAESYTALRGWGARSVPALRSPFTGGAGKAAPNPLPSLFQGKNSLTDGN